MSDAQIFQLFSLVYIAVGVGILINPDFYKKIYQDFIDSGMVVYFGGFTALAIGYLLVTFHNVWEMDWHVIITIFGWIALIKGMLILVRPEAIIAIAKIFVNNEKALKIEAIVVLLLGLLFSFLGFCPKSPLL